MAEPELFLGLISGTSADGIDAALCAFPAPGAAAAPIRVVAAQTQPYPQDLREQVVALARSHASIALDELGSLDVRIGECFATAATALLDAHRIDAAEVAAIGSHGQTICHRPLGRWPFSMQIGDASVIAARTSIITVADFRRADVAAGGQGAPLLPALHAAVLADPAIPRAILNLGGIGNLTLLRPGHAVIGFDTGPANCLLDAWALCQHGQARDEGGAWARSGRVDHRLLARCLDDPYFSAPPPKSTGREVFNLDWLDERMPSAVAAADVQATLLELSARSIADALQTNAPDVRELYACGGGVHNAALMDALRAQLPEVRIATTAALGLDPDFVEAAGFAWLARETLAGRPGNLPSVTGARGARVLGAIYPASR